MSRGLVSIMDWLATGYQKVVNDEHMLTKQQDLRGPKLFKNNLFFERQNKLTRQRALAWPSPPTRKLGNLLKN